MQLLVSYLRITYLWKAVASSTNFFGICKRRLFSECHVLHTAAMNIIFKNTKKYYAQNEKMVTVWNYVIGFYDLAFDGRIDAKIVSNRTEIKAKDPQILVSLEKTTS